MNSKGVQELKSASGIAFLFAGVSKVTLWLKKVSKPFIYISCFWWAPPASIHCYNVFDFYTTWYGFPLHPPCVLTEHSH